MFSLEPSTSSRDVTPKFSEPGVPKRFAPKEAEPNHAARRTTPRSPHGSRLSSREGVASLHTARPIAEAVLGSEDARASDDPTSEHGAGGDLPQAELGAGAADFASRVSPDFEAFVQTHKKAGHTYCPGSSAGVPCIEAMRR